MYKTTLAGIVLFMFQNSLAQETGLVGYVYVGSTKGHTDLLLEADWAAAEELYNSLKVVESRGIRKKIKRSQELHCVHDLRKQVPPGREFICQSLLSKEMTFTAPNSIKAFEFPMKSGLGSAWNLTEENYLKLILRHDPADRLQEFLNDQVTVKGSTVFCELVRKSRLPRSGIRVPWGSLYRQCILQFKNG